MQFFYFKDADGRVFKSTSSLAPPGCVPHVPRVVGDGEAVTVPFYLSDSASSGSGLPEHMRATARRGIEMALAHQGRPAAQATFDAAGRTPLSDSTCSVSDALATAPAETGALGFKTQQAMAEAHGATGSHLQDVLRRLDESASAYRGIHAYQATTDAAKAACVRAADSIDGFIKAKRFVADGRQPERTAPPVRDANVTDAQAIERAAYLASVERLTAGFRRYA